MLADEPTTWNGTNVWSRAPEIMALCESLRLTKETMAAVDGRLLRAATCDVVRAWKMDGVPIQRVITRVKTLAGEAGFPLAERPVMPPDDEHLRILLEEVIRLCIEEYYR
jgi:hypothetical protein